VKKLKMKKKIVAIFVVLLLTALSLNVAEAGDINTATEENNTFIVEYGNVNEDGTFTTEQVYLTEEEVVELETQISSMMAEIETAENIESIGAIIDKYLPQSTPIFSGIFKIFSAIKNLFNRAIVISSGYGYSFNPFRKSSIKIRKTFAIWHYSPEKIFKGRTIIIRPLKLKLKVLKGLQVGFMTRFIGIYLNIKKSFPQKSYTFFMGLARRAIGVQLLPS